VQADILDRCPDDCQATGLRREHVDLLSPLPYITEQTFNSIRALNVSMHALRELVNEVGSQRVASPIDSEERFSQVVTL
jgi:hypothetical protein